MVKPQNYMHGGIVSVFWQLMELYEQVSYLSNWLSAYVLKENGNLLWRKREGPFIIE